MGEGHKTDTRFTHGWTERILEHPALAGVDPGLVLPILTSVRAISVRAGTFVNSPDRAQCTLVLSGRLHSYVLDPDGRRLVFEILGAGSIDGLLNVVPTLEGHFTEAIRRSLVVPLKSPVLNQLIDAEPKIAVNLLRLLLRRLERREMQLASATHHEATRRVARLLLSLSHYLGSPPLSFDAPALVDLRPKPSHQLIADMIGLRRETVTLHLGVLRRARAVRVENDHFTLDCPKLRRIVDGAPATRVESTMPGDVAQADIRPLG